MRVLLITLSFVFITLSSPAFAQLKRFTDYDVSDEVWNITTVKIDPNRGDDYLEGIKATWVASNEVAKQLGQIEDYAIYGSDLPLSGEFNLMLVVKFRSTADLAPSRERYEAFIAEWTEKRQSESREIFKDYPAMREITGEYQMRKITIK